MTKGEINKLYEDKANENIETKTLDKICCVLDCKIDDILEYIKD